jgi:hypothetical protein
MKALIVTFLSILFSYQSTAQDTLASVEKLMLGTWEWEMTIHSGKGSVKRDTTTPTTCYCNEEFLLVKGNRMKYTYNGKSTSGGYEIKITDRLRDQVRFSIYSEKLSGSLYVLDKDRIVITRFACGPSAIYRRKTAAPPDSKS